MSLRFNPAHRRSSIGGSDARIIARCRPAGARGSEQTAAAPDWPSPCIPITRYS